MRAPHDGRCHLLADNGGRTELFDVERDPAELRDLAAQHPEHVDRLRALLR